MPNWIDRAIGIFAPEREMRRVRARMKAQMYRDTHSRLYKGAADGRRASNWRSRSSSANTEIAEGIVALRNRARELVRNTPHAPRMIDVFTSHAVGTGIRAHCSTGKEMLDARVDDLWQQWCEKCDVEGRLSFGAMQALATREIIEAGEIVVKMIDRRPSEIAHRKAILPFQLQMLEGDFIDHSRDGLYAPQRQPERRIARSRLGVGLSEYDERAGLWLWPLHPGEMATTKTMNVVSDLVPMDNLLHVFRALRAGQVRGVTWFAPILTAARELADFVDAVTVKARVEACFAAFVTNPDEFEQLTDDVTGTAAAGLQSFANPDAAVTMLEPGMIKELRGGQDIKFAQPTSAVQVEPMLMFNLMAQAAGLGITYDQLSGDLRQANYSSLRAGKIDFRKQVEHVQQHVIIPQLCQPVWDRFIDRAIVSGLLRERGEGYAVQWTTPAWEAVNPKFDLDAEERSVRAGRMTPQEFIASWGSNWRQVLKDTRDFYKLADEYGLVFDIDARKVTKQGQSQKAAGGGGNKRPPADAAAEPVNGNPPRKPNGNGAAAQPDE